MKKTISVFLACLMLFLFTACTEKNPPETTPAESDRQPTTEEYNSAMLQKFIEASEYNRNAEHISYDIYGKMTMKYNGEERIQNTTGSARATISGENPLYYSIRNTVSEGETSSKIEAYENGVGYYSDMGIKLKSECSYTEFSDFLDSLEEKDDAVPELEYSCFSKFTFEETSEKYFGSFEEPSEEIMDQLKQYFDQTLRGTISQDAVLNIQMNAFQIQSIISKKGYEESASLMLSATITFSLPEMDQPMTISFEIEETNTLTSIDTQLEITLPFDKSAFIPTQSLSLSAQLNDKLSEYTQKTYGECEISSGYTVSCTQNEKTDGVSQKASFAVRYQENQTLQECSSELNLVYSNGDTEKMLEYYKNGIYYTKVGSTTEKFEITAEEMDGYLSDSFRFELPFEIINAIEYRQNEDGTQTLSCKINSEEYRNYLAYTALSIVYSNYEELWETSRQIDQTELAYTLLFDKENNIISIALSVDLTAIMDGKNDINIRYHCSSEITKSGSAEIHPLSVASQT